MRGQCAVLLACLLVLFVGTCGYSDEYQGWIGHWEDVVATAYTPSDPIDDAYHATKGTRWRWITADGRTDVRREPYGIAVPLRHGGPWWAFGTRVIIPVGAGYLDRCRADERLFRVDDVGDGKEYFATERGQAHIDLRFVDRRDALRWAGPEGQRPLRVFVCSRPAPQPEPVPAWVYAPALPAFPVEPVSVPVMVAAEPIEEGGLMGEWPLNAWAIGGGSMLLLVTALRYRRRESWEPPR